MARFVILTHDWPQLHWDFMLEAGESLRTWRLAVEPVPGEVIPAEPLPDHRRAYLDYEGAVSGGRGHVSRWDSGEFEILSKNIGEELVIRLAGRKLRGRASLLVAGKGVFLNLTQLSIGK